ncbi:MAG: hypothetical protein JSU83_12105 [Deltaproteobacteria bacterium]|nr:MAG: hypothetical protein JSU83_12105 [Deltaproteobacteria bacterium]
MEVKETAACGISQREFAIEFDNDELLEMVRLLRYVTDETDSYDEGFLEDLKSQMAYIIGPSLEEALPEEILEQKMEWEDTGISFNLTFNDEMARKLWQILERAETPDQDVDRELLNRMVDELRTINPMVVDNLPGTSRY